MTDGGLRVISVSDPANPTEVGHYQMPGSAVDVAVAGDYAYVADESLLVFSVADSAQPVEVGHCFVPGGVLEVAVSGDHAFLTAQDSELQVVATWGCRYTATMAVESRKLRMTKCK